MTVQEATSYIYQLFVFKYDREREFLLAVAHSIFFMILFLRLDNFFSKINRLPPLASPHTKLATRRSHFFS